MAFSGTDSILSSLIKSELLREFPEIRENAETEERLSKLANAISRAILQWILSVSDNSVQANINVTVNPGIPIQASPSGTGTTIAPGTGTGIVVTSKLV